MKCSFCEETNPDALRPFGPGRSLTCKPCAESDPERAAIAGMYWDEELKKNPPKVFVLDITTDLLSKLFGSCDEPDCEVCKRVKAAEKTEQQEATPT